MHIKLKVQTICNLSFVFASFFIYISVDRRSKNQLPVRHAGSQNKKISL